jgi:hypothetical protein
MSECTHPHMINRGDACLCPSCGLESTVFGTFYHRQPHLGIAIRFYRGEIGHPEVDDLLTLAEKWR